MKDNLKFAGAVIVTIGVFTLLGIPLKISVASFAIAGAYVYLFPPKEKNSERLKN